MHTYLRNFNQFLPELIYALSWIGNIMLRPWIYKANYKCLRKRFCQGNEQLAQSSTPPFSNALFDNFMHIRATLQCVPITIALLLACLLTKIYGTDGMYYTTRVLFVIKTLMISLSLLLTRSPRLQMVLLEYKFTGNSRFS